MLRFRKLRRQGRCVTLGHLRQLPQARQRHLGFLMEDLILFNLAVRLAGRS